MSGDEPGHGGLGDADERRLLAKALEGDDAPSGALLSSIAAWRAETAAPSPALEARVMEALAGASGKVVAAASGKVVGAASAASASPPLRAGRRAPRANAPVRGRGAPRWLAAAAVAVLALGALAYFSGLPFQRAEPARAPRGILVADALRAAEHAAHEHASAIAELERAAAPILTQADDPKLPPEQAARLLAYRDRLRALDSAIAEVEGILHENPGHAGARTVLLAAFMDKTQLLHEVLTLDKGTTGDKGETS